MNPLASITAVLAASVTAVLAASSALPSSASHACALSEAAELCPSCDGQNTTDSNGQTWSITCDWVIDADIEQEVGGDVSWATCLDACDDAHGCVGVNFAANGSCIVASGEQQALRSSPAFTNLVRIATSAATPVSITATYTAPGTSSTGLGASCSLDDPAMCPKCNGQVVVDSLGKAYRVLCDTSITSNGSYSPQKWLSPEDCLLECDKLAFCTGVTSYDERSCVIAKANPSATYEDSFTAFFPLFTASSKTDGGVSRTSQALTTAAAAVVAKSEPTLSILPIDPRCDPSAITCPACEGETYTDKLNGSYTVFCNIEPTCMSTSIHRDAGTLDLCTKSCDQGVTCLAAMWYPDSKACHLCLQGINKAVERSNLPYLLLVADNDGDADEGDATLSIASTVTSTATSSSSKATRPVAITATITALPSPFPTEINTLGPVSVALLPPIESSGRPNQNHTSSSSSPKATSTSPSLANATCPEYDDNAYIDANGNYFVVGCDSRFDAAHSRFVSASDFAACAASCTGSCDGVQFGAATRCGLFTDISIVGPATGWTIAARITFPGTAVGLPASITSVATLSKSSRPAPPTTTFFSSWTNGTVSWTSSAVTRPVSAPIGYGPPAYNPL